MLQYLARDKQTFALQKLSLVNTKLWLFYLILFFMATLPSLHSLSFIASWYAEKRLAQIIIFIALVLITILSPNFQSHIKNYWVDIPTANKALVISFFTFGIISASQAALPVWAFTEIGNYCLLFLLSLFIAHIIRSNQDSNKLIIYACVISAILYLIPFLASLAAGLTSGTVDYAYLISGFVNRRFLNQYQSILFPILLLAPLFFAVNKRLYFGLSLLAAFCFMLILISDGRGAFVASILGVAISGILFPYQRKKWLLHAIFVITLAIILFLAFDYLVSTQEVISGDITRGATGGRLPIWIGVITLIQESPIFGLGPMHYAFVPHEFRVAHPHNITLQLISEWGLPAALSIIVVIFTGFIQWVKQQRSTPATKNSLVPTAVTASFIAAIIHGHLSGVFVMPLSQLSFAVISGWIIGIYYKDSPLKNPTTASFKSSLVIILCVILSLIFLLNGSYPHMKSLITEIYPDDLYLEGNYPAASAPRFWLFTYHSKP